jgi:prolipoprotein diacylglyceryltransferase
MKFPVYIHLFGLSLHPHVVFESLAYTIGFFIFRRLKKHFGDLVPQQVRWSVIAAAAVGAVVGSKLLYWLEDPHLIMTHWNNFEIVWGGKTIVGGLLGGLVAVEWTKRQMHFAGRTGDLFGVPLCIGIAIGRIGCFLTGLADQTYGTPTSLPWGVDFGDGIRRHPAQLYELIFLLLLAGFLFRAMRRPHVQGDIFKMFMVGYCGWRLAIDFMKPDPRFFRLNSIQWAALAVLVFYSRDILRWAITPKAAKAANTGNCQD